MRAACGLNAEERGPPPGGRQSRVATRPGRGGDRGGEAGTWLAAGRRRAACPVPCVSRAALLGERGWDFRSEHHVSRLHQDVWPRVPAKDRVGALRQLKASGWWKELLLRGRSGAPLIPRIPTERGLCWTSSRLCRTAPNPSHTAERCRPTLCVSWCDCVAPTSHLVKLQEARDAMANHRGHGVMNATDERNEGKMGRERPENTGSHLAWCATQVAVVETDNMANLVLSQGGTTIANLVRYQKKYVTSVAGIRHRSGRSAAATWFWPTCCLLLRGITTW